MAAQGNDWLPSRVVGEIKIRGGNLRELSRNSGLHADTLRNALYRHCPKYEQIISDYLGVPMEKIWPSRYPSATKTKSKSVAKKDATKTTKSK